MNSDTGIQKVETLCSKCRKPIPRFLAASAYTVVCSYCGGSYNAFLGKLEKTDATFKNAFRAFDIAIGTTGTLKGVSYLVIGICRKREKTTNYYWNEYLLFNPIKGYATLSEYNGHWNFIVEIPDIPTENSNKEVIHDHLIYDLYYGYVAQTVQAIGEFPFKLTPSEEVKVKEYIAAPYMLSVERSSEESVWYKGEYIKSKEIKSAFNLQKITPSVGVGATQPVGPQFSLQALNNLAIFVTLLFCVLHTIFYYSADEKVVFDEHYSITDSTVRKEIYTKPFELKGATKNLEVRINTNVDNTWMYTGITLVNEATGDVYDLDIEAEYYHGYSDGESWSEGNSWNSKVFSQIPEGKYYLIIYPDRQANAHPTSLQIVVTRDVIITSNMLVSLGLLLVFPVFLHYRKQFFESLKE